MDFDEKIKANKIPKLKNICCFKFFKNKNYTKPNQTLDLVDSNSDEKNLKSK